MTKLEELKKEFGNNTAVRINEILEEYTTFLCKWSYTDSDVYAEEPKAVDRFLNE